MSLLRPAAWTLIALLTAQSVPAQITTSTPALGLQIPQFNSPQWQIPIGQNFYQIDQMLSGSTPIPGLTVSGPLTVTGAFTAPNLTFTSQQIANAIGYTPVKTDLSNITNPAAALASIGGLPATAPTAWASGTSYGVNALVFGSDLATYISRIPNNAGNNPTAAGSTAWAKFANAAPAIAAPAGALLTAGANGAIQGATANSITSTLGYTPANSANNLSDIASPATALANLGGATAASVSSVQGVATAALPKAGGSLTGDVTSKDGTALISTGSVNTMLAPVASAANNALPKSGGALTGPLTLANDSPTGSQAASANYVQSQLASVSSGVSNALPTTGGTLTGPLTLATDSPTGKQAASANYVVNQITPISSTASTANTNASTALSTAQSAQATANNAVQPNTAPSFSSVTVTGLKGAPCVGTDANGKYISVPCGTGGTPLPPATAANQVPVYQTANSSTVTPVTLAPSALTDTTNAANITSGTLALAQVPSIPVGKVTGTLPVSQLPTIPTTQLSGLAPSATTDTTNAGNITTGTLPTVVLPTIPAAKLPTVQTQLASVSGCTTTGYVYSPASGTCIAQPSGGAALPTSTSPNQALVATSANSSSYTPVTLAASATTDTTNAGNITTGTLSTAVIPAIPLAKLSAVTPSAIGAATSTQGALAATAIQPNTTPTLQQISLAADPTIATQASTKNYVDTSITNLFGSNNSAGFPTPPSGANVFSNLQVAGGNPGSWQACSTGICGGGTLPNGSPATGSGSLAQGVSSPALNGSSLSLTSNGPSFNTLSYRQWPAQVAVSTAQQTTSSGTLTINATPTQTYSTFNVQGMASDTKYNITSVILYVDGAATQTFTVSSTSYAYQILTQNLSGPHTIAVKAFNSNGDSALITYSPTFGVACSSVNSISKTYSVYVPSTTTKIQAYESGTNMDCGNKEYFPTVQIDLNNNVNVWNGATNQWVTTGHTVALSTNAWHKIQFYSTINQPAAQYTYQDIYIDNNPILQNAALGPYGAGNVTSADKISDVLQLDNQYNNGATTSNVIYYDGDTTSLWSGPYISVGASGASTSAQQVVSLASTAIQPNTTPALTGVVIPALKSSPYAGFDANGNLVAAPTPSGATLPTSTAPNQALVATAANSSSYAPVTLAPSATTDTTNATNITAGTLTTTVLPTIPVAKLPTVQSQLATASGCTTTGYVYSPASGVCIAQPSGGAALPTSTAQNQALVATAANSSSYTPVTLAPSATTDTTNAANITTGLLPTAVLPAIPVAKLPTIPYTQLSGTPTVPTKVSQITNDTGFVTAATAPVNYPLVTNYGAVSGQDATTALKNALTANQNNSLYFPAGTYTISSVIKLNVNQIILGAGNGATTLNCTMTSGPCIVYGGPSSSTYTTAGLRALTLNGPGSSNANSIGLYLGGDPAGTILPSNYYANGMGVQSVTIQNFGSGVQWGNNAWLNAFSDSWILNNAIGMNAPSGTSNSGEAITLHNVTIANGGQPIVDNAGYEFIIDGSAIDYNSSPISTNNGYIYVTGTHFEQSSGSFFSVPYGYPNISIHQSDFLLQNSTGTDKDFFDLYPQGMSFSLADDNFYANHAVGALIDGGGTSNSIAGRVQNISSGSPSRIPLILNTANVTASNLMLDQFGIPNQGSGAALPASTAVNQVPVYKTANSSTVTPTALAASAFTDTTNAANVTTGTLSTAVIPSLPLAKLPTIPYTQLSGVTPTAIGALPTTGGTISGTLTLSDSSPAASQSYVTSHAGAPTATNIQSALSGASNCTTNGTVYSPASGTCITAPAGAASSVGISQAVQVSGGSGNGVVADNAIQVASDHSLVTAWPRANIRSSLFALGWTYNNVTQASCAGVNGNSSGYADPSGSQDSTCAAQSAIAYLKARRGTSANSNTGTLYLPAGTFKISGTLLIQGMGVRVEGDAHGATYLLDVSPTATAIEYLGAIGSELTNIHVLGTGHNSTSTGVEIIDTQEFLMDHVEIENFGYVSLSLVGSTERSKFLNSDIKSPRKAVNSHGDVNEVYFDHVNVLYGGNDANNYCYSRTICTNGVVPGGNGTTPTPWQVDPTALISLEGDNVAWLNSSIKGLVLASGIQYTGGNGRFQNLYLEGYANYNPALNRAIQLIGSAEIGRTTAAVTATATAIPVDDAPYLPGFIADVNYAKTASIHASDGPYKLACSDFVWGSTDQSTVCPGVLKGQYEIVNVNGVGSDGNMYGTREVAANTSHGGGVTSAGVACAATPTTWNSGTAYTQGQTVVFTQTYPNNGAWTGRFNALSANTGVTPTQTSSTWQACGAGEINAGFAWPAGAITAHVPASNYGPTVIASNHINTDDGSAMPAGFTAVTSDTVKKPLNTPGGNTEMAADIVVGPEPDGFVIPFPNVAAVTNGASASLQGNAMYFDNSEVNGAGWVKVPGKGVVSYDSVGVDGLPENPYNATNLANGFFFGGQENAAFVNWSGTFADGLMTSTAKNVYWQPNQGIFQGAYRFYSGPGFNFEKHIQAISSRQTCDEFSPQAGGNGARTCRNANSVWNDVWNGNAWVRSGTATVNGLTFTTTDYSTGGAIAPGTRYAHLTPPAGGATYTLPTLGQGQELNVYLFNGNPATLTSAAGQGFYYNDKGFGTAGSLTLPGSLVTIQCVGDQYGNVICNGPNQPFAASLGSTGAGLGATSTAAAVTGTGQTSRFTATTTAAGTAGSVVATINFTPALAHAPLDCSVTPQGPLAAQAGLYVQPFTAGAALGSIQIVAANALGAGQVTFDTNCRRD